MWLLDTEDGTFLHVDRPHEYRYAILSHVWRRGGEESFQDLLVLQAQAASMSKKKLARHLSRLFSGGQTSNAPSPSLKSNTRGKPSALAAASDKVRECCALARQHGYRWAWIDSCCIDKTSSAELSEAINSMFDWYAAADVCFAFLEDVGDDHDPRARDSAFRRARWFTRGFTLQELVAPRALVFVSRSWRVLGTRQALAELVAEITGVERAVLMREKAPGAVSVAQRMAWAARRQTTRVEDRAYSLMGIFGVNMPTVYGEGAHAFLRLQEEILRSVPDQSLFAWGPSLADDSALFRAPGEEGKMTRAGAADDGRYWHSRNLFAWSPDAFVNSTGVMAVPFEKFEALAGTPFAWSDHATTSFGMRTRFPLIALTSGEKTTYLAVLAAEDAEGRLLALLLYPQQGVSGHFYVGHYVGNSQVPPNAFFRLVSLSRTHGMTRLHDAVIMDVCIPFRSDPPTSRMQPPPEPPPTYKCPCDIVIPGWIVSALEQEGFVVTIDMNGRRSEARNEAMMCVTETTALSDCTIVLKGTLETLRIQLGRCPCLGAYLTVSVVGSASQSGGVTRVGTATSSELASGATLVGSKELTPEDNKPRAGYSRLAAHTRAERTPSGQRRNTLAPTCPSGHVAAWEGGAKAFVYGERTVRLAFSAWLTRANVYSLTVELGTLGQEQ